MSPMSCVFIFLLVDLEFATESKDVGTLLSGNKIICFNYLVSENRNYEYHPS